MSRRNSQYLRVSIAVVEEIEAGYGLRKTEPDRRRSGLPLYMVRMVEKERMERTRERTARVQRRDSGEVL